MLERRAWITRVLAGVSSLSGTRLRAQARRLRVKAFFPGQVPYFDALRKGMLQAAASREIAVEWVHANWDASAQIRQIEASIGRGFDALAVCAVDNRALEAVPALLQKRSLPIPLVTFTNAIGSEVTGAFPGVHAFIGRDELESGALLASFVRTLFPDKSASILLVEGSPGTPPQRLRTQGFVDAINADKRHQIVRRMAIEGWRVDVVEAQMLRLASGDFNIIATHWAGAACAAARALRARGRKNVPIISLEYTEELQKEMLEGYVKFTTTHDVIEEGRTVISVVARIIQGETYSAFAKIAQQIVDPTLAKKVVPLW